MRSLVTGSLAAMPAFVVVAPCGDGSPSAPPSDDGGAPDGAAPGPPNTPDAPDAQPPSYDLGGARSRVLAELSILRRLPGERPLPKTGCP